MERFDSVPRADTGKHSATEAGVAAALLLGGDATNFDAFAMPQCARFDSGEASPFDPDTLALEPKVQQLMRRDGGGDGFVKRGFSRLAWHLMQAHFKSQGIAIERKDGQRIDSTNTPFLPYELTFRQQVPRDELYPTLKSRRFIPISHEAPPGATTITFRELRRAGEAVLIANYGQDVPRMDVWMTETSVNVRSIACSYGYTMQDLDAAAMANRPLPAWKAEAAARACEQRLDALLFAGDANAGLVGFNGLTGITDEALPTENWIAGAATPAQIMADVNDLINTGINAQLDQEEWEFDTILFPSLQFEHMNRTIVGVDNASNDTILKVLQKNNPGITFAKWNRLTAAGAGAATRAIAYKKSNIVVQGHIPREMTPLAPQLDAFEYVIYCYARIGGVENPYPLAIRWADGI